MVTDQMLVFIRSQRARGVSDDDIRAQLKLNNWSDEDIAKGFKNIDGQSAPTPAPAPTPQAQKKTKKGLSLAIIIPIIFVFLAGGVGAFYAFSQNLWPFGAAGVYTEENILSGLLAKAKEIRTSRYSLSLDVQVVDRQQGAVPFTYELPNKEEIEEMRGRDRDRLLDIDRILFGLRLESDFDGAFPENLTGIVNDIRSNSFRDLDGVDPVTNRMYPYSSDGETFELRATFETDDAIRAVELSQYGDYEVTVEGKTAIFTQDSSYNVYPISEEVPKPYLVEWGESIGFLPSEFELTGGVTAASDFSGENSDWEIALAGEGDLGDLTYKVAAQAKKVGDMYYFKLDNFPNILFFLGDLNVFKGQWIEINPSEDEDPYSFIGSLASGIPEAEEKYLEDRDAAIRLFGNAARIGDEEQVVSFVRAPYSDDIAGSTYTRYDVTLDREAMLRFARRAKDELREDANSILGQPLVDDALITYLESDEYGEMHAYLEEYTSVSMWVDRQGFPVQYQYNMRLIPQDAVIQLADKEVQVTTTLTLSDINVPLRIEAPDDAKTLQEIEEGVDAVTGGSLSAARARGADANIKANLATVSVQAELFYDSNSNLYSNTVIEADACRPVAGSLFADTLVNDALEEIASRAGVDPYCASSGKNYAVSSRLPSESGKYYCVDSTGYRGEIPAHIIEPSCQ